MEGFVPPFISRDIEARDGSSIVLKLGYFLVQRHVGDQVRRAVLEAAPRVHVHRLPRNCWSSRARDGHRACRACGTVLARRGGGVSRYCRPTAAINVGRANTPTA